MRFTVALLATLLFADAAFADGSDRKDPFGDKLLTAGAATFTVAYAPMTVAGTVYAGVTGGVPEYGGMFFAPVASPFAWTANAAMFGHGSNDAILIGTLSFFDGAAQVVGIALMIGGSVHRHRVAARATPTLSLR
jgi:hypothetical protein